MKIRYAVLLFFIATFVSYWFVDARSRASYANDGDIQYYVPPIWAMDTLEDIIGTADNTKKKRSELVVLYVYNLNNQEQEPTGTVDGEPVHSAAFKAVRGTYDNIQSFVERENDRFEAAGPRGVQFAAVNLFHGNLSEVPTRYNLGRVPLLAFFRNSELVAQQPLGQSVTSINEIEHFLIKAKFFDFLRDATERYQAKSAKERKRDRDLRRRYWYGGGFGCGYSPYCYYGPVGPYGWGAPGYWNYGYRAYPYGGLYIG